MDLPAGPDKLSAANDANPFPRLPATLKVHVEYHHANGMTKDNMELPLPYQAVRKVNGNVVSQVSITQDFEYWLPSCGLIMMDALDPVSAADLRPGRAEESAWTEPQPPSFEEVPIHLSELHSCRHKHDPGLLFQHSALRGRHFQSYG